MTLGLLLFIVGRDHGRVLPVFEDLLSKRWVEAGESGLHHCDPGFAGLGSLEDV
jgi:hypothetical protein